MTKHRYYLKRLAPILLVLGALIALMLCSAEAVESAQNGLSLCARVIIPSLLPFFVLSSLLSELGLPRYLGRLAAPLMEKLFGVGGAGAASFILGLSGGYPLGAKTVMDLYQKGDVSRDEAERLIAFCNNSGPAFILGVAGAGVFHSSAAGLLLYGVHIAASVLVGLLLSGRGGGDHHTAPHFSVATLPQALAVAVKSSVAATLNICGFVIFFTVLVGVLDALGVFGAVAGELSAALGLELHWVRSLLTGALELGSGIGSMAGLAVTPWNLALCAFILGWGGLSVHCQTLSLTAGTEVRCTRHFVGRALHGLISAVLAFVLAALL